MAFKRRPSGIRICYLCCKALDRKAPGATIDKDHVPPDRWFASSLKKFGPQLITLPVHRGCQAAFEHDEVYFFNTLLPGATGAPAASEAMKDLQASFKYEEQRRLGLKVLEEFGTVMTADGKIAKSYRPSRVNRVLWKVVRGLFFIEYDKRVLPAKTPHAIEIYGPEEGERLPPEFALVRDTQSRGRYEGVFGYKLIELDYPEHPEAPAFKLHYWALLLWDRIIVTVAFHDPACECTICLDGRSSEGEDKPEEQSTTVDAQADPTD